MSSSLLFDEILRLVSAQHSPDFEFERRARRRNRHALTLPIGILPSSDTILAYAVRPKNRGNRNPHRTRSPAEQRNASGVKAGRGTCSLGNCRRGGELVGFGAPVRPPAFRIEPFLPAAFYASRWRSPPVSATRIDPMAALHYE